VPVLHDNMHGFGGLGASWYLISIPQFFRAPARTGRVPHRHAYPERKLFAALAQARGRTLQGIASKEAPSLLCERAARNSQCRQGHGNPRVTDVKLGLLYQAFADVRIPGEEQPDHERAFQDIDIMFYGHIGNPERAAQLRIIHTCP